MQTDAMRESAVMAKENLVWVMAQIGKRHALQAGVQTYEPVADALSKVCLWIIQYDKATDEQKRSPEMFESWFASQDFAGLMFDQAWDKLNAVRNRWLDLFYEEMMRPDDDKQEAA